MKSRGALPNIGNDNILQRPVIHGGLFLNDFQCTRPVDYLPARIYISK